MLISHLYETRELILELKGRAGSACNEATHNQRHEV